MKLENLNKAEQLSKQLKDVEDFISYLEYFNSDKAKKNQHTHKSRIKLEGKSESGNYVEKWIDFPNRLMESQLLCALLHDQRWKKEELLKKIKEL